jgi:hypothetical protein
MLSFPLCGLAQARAASPACHLTSIAVAADDCRLMSRHARVPRGRWHRAIVVLLLLAAACGKKGPPLAPLRIAPNRIEDLAVAKTGDEVRAQFTVPSTNADGSRPADLTAVELYAISGKPEDPAGNSLAGGEFIRLGQLAGRVEVAQPEAPEDEDAPPPPATVADRARAAAEAAAARARQALPEQGATATITERLTKDALVPFVHPGRRPAKPPVPPATMPGPLGPPPPDDPFSRTYIAVGVSRHGTRSAVSNRVTLPLLDAPPPPTGITVTHAEATATIAWTEPPGTQRRVQRPAAAGELEARSLAPAVVPTTYNVYRVTRTASGDQPSPTPLNATPVESTEYTQGPIALGERGCYQVRSVRVFGSARLESGPSETACTTFVDTFAPPAPSNLAAVGSEGGVSLIWDPSPGGDVAGYLVLRGEIGPGGPPETLTPLTAQPIRETTYRDATPRPGIRYVYAVVALDGATPPNRSAESNRVEEGAR